MKNFKINFFLITLSFIANVLYFFSSFKEKKNLKLKIKYFKNINQIKICENVSATTNTSTDASSTATASSGMGWIIQ